MPEYPHQLLERFCADRIGRRADLFGQFADQLFIPLVRSAADQLSVYTDQRPGARLRCKSVTLLEGSERTYLMARIVDGGAPLRLSSIFHRWTIELQSSQAMELGNVINARRWRFIDRWLSRFFGPLLERMADTLIEYYARRPYAVPKAGLIRFLEGVDATFLCCEVDDRSEASHHETVARYRVQ